MLRFENVSGSVHLSGLLAAAAALQELAGSVPDLQRIPEILRKVLAAESVTLSVTHRDDDGAEAVLVHATSGKPNAHAAAGKEPQRMISFEEKLDSTHQMKLIVRRMPDDVPADSIAEDVLSILSHHLVRSLQALLGGLAYPPRLKSPFTELTRREWTVLCGLNSDDSEKQIAERMHLSSHTLHSHIKALYRKIGVRGRLTLLRRFRAAWREYRLHMLAQPLEKRPLPPRADPPITVPKRDSPLGFPPASSLPAKKT